MQINPRRFTRRQLIGFLMVLLGIGMLGSAAAVIADSSNTSAQGSSVTRSAPSACELLRGGEALTTSGEQVTLTPKQLTGNACQYTGHGYTVTFVVKAHNAPKAYADDYQSADNTGKNPQQLSSKDNVGPNQFINAYQAFEVLAVGSDTIEYLTTFRPTTTTGGITESSSTSIWIAIVITSSNASIAHSPLSLKILASRSSW